MRYGIGYYYYRPAKNTGPEVPRWPPVHGSKMFLLTIRDEHSSYIYRLVIYTVKVSYYNLFSSIKLAM